MNNFDRVQIWQNSAAKGLFSSKFLGWTEVSTLLGKVNSGFGMSFQRSERKYTNFSETREMENDAADRGNWIVTFGESWVEVLGHWKENHNNILISMSGLVSDSCICQVGARAFDMTGVYCLWWFQSAITNGFVDVFFALLEGSWLFLWHEKRESARN